MWGFGEEIKSYGVGRITQDDRINLITANNEIVSYWDKETLKNSFEKKLPKLLYVKADARVKALMRSFGLMKAWLLSGFDFDNFFQLLKEGIILVDIRIGQYPHSRPMTMGQDLESFQVN